MIKKEEIALKKELINKAVEEWGLEDPNTITMLKLDAYLMPYNIMLAFYNYVNRRLAEDFGA